MSILTNHPEDSLTPSSGVLTIGATGALIIPQGSDAQRPNSVFAGQIRFSTASNRIEVYDGSAWTNLIDKSYVDLATADLQDQIDRIISNTDPVVLNSLSELVADYQSADQGLQDQIDLLNNQSSSALPTGSLGQVLFVETDNSNEVKFDYTLLTGTFVESDSERTSVQESNPSLEEIFSTWNRFSHNNTENQPGSNIDIQAWSFDPSTNLVTSTANTTTYVGFYSPNTYDTYNHEVRIKSTHFDNDTIGVLLAWYVDPATNRQYTLSALRSPGGDGFTWRMVYNFERSDQQVILDGTSQIKWGNGNLGSNAAAAAYSNSGPGWSAFATGTKIKVTRTNDTILCQTTNLGEDTYVSGANLQINLASLPILNKFRGPRSYGYGVFSQAQASFEVLDFPDIQSTVYDMRDGLVYSNANGSWAAVSGTSVIDQFGVGRLLHNSLSQKTYYTLPTGTIVKVGQAQEEVMMLTVSNEALVAGTAKYSFRAPFAMTLTKLPRISLASASTLNSVVIDINQNGVSIFGQDKLTVDANEKTSVGSSVATTLSKTTINDDDEISVDIDLAGTDAAGLKIALYYRK